MSAGIVITEGVSEAQGAEALRLIPRDAFCATVHWPLSPDFDDKPGPVVITALSQALARCGSVAFRYDDALEGARNLYYPEPSITNRLFDLFGLGKDSFGLVKATDPSVIASLFSYGGWSLAAQAALAYDPTMDALPIVNALRLGMNWRGRRLPHGVRLLFGPGHDGSFAVIAATERMWLDRFKAALG